MKLNPDWTLPTFRKKEGSGDVVYGTYEKSFPVKVKDWIFSHPFLLPEGFFPFFSLGANLIFWLAVIYGIYRLLRR